jgi:hypothetical protein
MNKTQSTEIVVRSDSSRASLDELDEILLTGELNVEVVEDPEQMGREIVAQLLSATSDAELESFGDAVGWREFAVPASRPEDGTPMEIRGFRWRPSSFEEGAPVFFVVRATRLDTGSPVTLTTGSLNVLAQLSNMARRGTLVGAIRVLVEKDEKTKGGFKPLWLVTPPGHEADPAAATDADA